MVLLLLTWRRPLAVQVDKDGWSALMYAAHSNHVVGSHLFSHKTRIKSNASIH